MATGGSYGNYGGPYDCRRACDNCDACEYRTNDWCTEDCWRCQVCRFRNVEGSPPAYPRMRPLYWRPHYYSYPRTCYNTCGYKTCDEFHDRLDKYQECLETNPVYVCRNRWGCSNPKGFRYPNTPPINPLYTGCTPCWKNGSFTTRFRRR